MEPSFSIQSVADRTGLSPHVIRAWERRYRAIEPKRSPGRHRLYSETEIDRLMLLHGAVRSGHRIGKIAGLPTDELGFLVSRQPASLAMSADGQSDAMSSLCDEALGAVSRFDGPALEDALRRALLLFGHMGFLQRVVAPLAQEIGERWRSGHLSAAHEHFFTSSVKVFLGDVRRQFTIPATAPCLIVTTPLGQIHELGAVMAAATAAGLGWRVVYLGAGLPSHEIAGAALRNEAAAVALSIVYPDDDPDLPRQLIDLARLLPATTRILVGGRAAKAYFDTLTAIGAFHSDSIETFGVQLDSVRSAAVGKSLNRAS